MKRWMMFLPVFLLAIGAHASDLRIVSWNIQDAQPHSKAGVVAKTAQEQKADVVALQGVNVTPYNLVNDLAEAFGKDWDYRVTTSAAGSRQLAVFWNTKTVHLKTTKVPKPGCYEETDIQAGDSSNLPAQIAYFQKGAFDFFLINVNLMQASQNQDLKLKQAEVLHNWVSGKKKALSGTENDFVVAGSFFFGFPGEKVNDEVMVNKSYDLMQGNGLLTFTMKEVWAKDPKAATYLGDWQDNDRLLDGFALSPGALRHYVKGSSQIVRVDKNYKDADSYAHCVSEHLPVLAKFKTDFED